MIKPISISYLTQVVIIIRPTRNEWGELSVSSRYSLPARVGFKRQEQFDQLRNESVGKQMTAIMGATFDVLRTDSIEFESVEYAIKEIDEYRNKQGTMILREVWFG